MRPIVIEGHKGAGKTPLIKAMKDILWSAGIKYVIAEPWQEAIKEFNIDPYYLFTDPQKARVITEYLSKYVRQAISSTEKDTLLVFDRQWLTFLTSVTLIDTVAAGISEAEYEQYFRKMLKYNPWTYFLASTPAILKSRAGRTSPPPWNEDSDYWNRLRIYNNHRNLFAGIQWIRQPRVDMDAIASRILCEYFNEVN